MKKWAAIGLIMAVVLLDGAVFGAVTGTTDPAMDPFERSASVADWQSLDFRGADLSYHDFSNAHLDGADFWFADLRHAVFVHASLVDADLFRSRLKWAELDFGDLRESRLKYSDLRHASLVDADLRLSDLRGANLQEADLRGTDLRWIRWNSKTRFEGALYDGSTLFPEAFEPIEAGMVAPEPSTALMLGLGLMGLAFCGHRRSSAIF